MVALWICVCAYLNCAGWILSALHALNRTGYVVAFMLGAVGVVVWRKRTGGKIFPRVHWQRLKRRFCRPFPFAFLVLAIMAFSGGALHPPSNYDGLAYREPRMLHWLAERQWHWIHTDFQRLNSRTAGYEWVCTPLIAFTNTDRLLFLIETASFLLLPGLLFSVFTRVGVRRRTAWHWMWVLPGGYCFLLQAGSIANDLFGATFALAAVDFALRARKSGRLSEVCLSVIAAGLLTGAKATNLPMLLPWAIAMLPNVRLALARPFALGLAALVALGASFVPTAILNWKYCGDWTGRAAEAVNIGGGPAWLYLLNNGINLALDGFMPPVFPFASTWNAATPRLIPDWLAGPLEKYFEPAAAHWRLGEMQTEESAGLGFGVVTLVTVSLAWVALRRLRDARRTAAARPDWLPRAVCVGAWISISVALANMGLSGVPRYCTPYFGLLLMGLLQGADHAELTRRKWWRGWAFVGFGLAAMLLVISQARPLWPARWFIGHYRAQLQASSIGKRALTVYEVYGQRHDAFAPARKILPTDTSPLGLVTFDDPETSLWRPFGSRRMLHVRAGESPEAVRRRGIRYVFVNVEKLREPWEQWLQRMDARVVDTVELQLRAGRGPFVWRLVELNPAAESKR